MWNHEATFAYQSTGALFAWYKVAKLPLAVASAET